VADFWRAGQLVELDAAWSNAANPTSEAVFYTVTPTEGMGAGVEGDPIDLSGSIVSDGSGKFHAVLDTTGLAGTLIRYRWLSAGTGQAAAVGSFFVL
jgi:hypothetical protein